MPRLTLWLRTDRTVVRCCTCYISVWAALGYKNLGGLNIPTPLSFFHSSHSISRPYLTATLSHCYRVNNLFNLLPGIEVRRAARLGMDRSLRSVSAVRLIGMSCPSVVSSWRLFDVGLSVRLSGEWSFRPRLYTVSQKNCSASVTHSANWPLWVTRLLTVLLDSGVSVYALAFVLEADILSTGLNKDCVMWHIQQWLFWETNNCQSCLLVFG